MPALSRLRLAVRALLELLLLQRKAWRHAGHGAVYLLLLVISAWLIEPLKDLDWQVADALDLRSSGWPPRVEIIDLGWDMDPATLGAFRADLAATLQALADLPEPPSMVVVDVTLSTVDLGLPALGQATQALQARRTALFGVANPENFVPGISRSQGLERQGQGAIYHYKALMGHTLFHFNGNSFWYQPCLPLASLEQAACLPAVAYQVGHKAARPEQQVPPASGTSAPVLFQLGDPGLLEGHRWRRQDGRLVSAGRAAREVGELAHAIVIVGNLKHDRVADRPGPEVLAWAIGASITPSPPGQPRLLALVSPGWALGMALLFSGVQVALFAALRRLRTLERRVAARSALSVLGALALFAAAVIGLRLGLHAVYLQVSFVVVAVLIAAALSGHAARAALRERALYTDVSATEPLENEEHHDVFISYSHTPAENFDWVRSKLAEPLKKETIDGRRLDVFFDHDSLGVGTSWYFELARAIENSDCFVAVYSSDYFRKSFCNFELGKAVVRDISDQGQRFRVLPLMRGQVAVPGVYSHLQFTQAGDSKEMVAVVLKALKELQARRRQQNGAQGSGGEPEDAGAQPPSSRSASQAGNPR